MSEPRTCRCGSVTYTPDLVDAGSVRCLLCGDVLHGADWPFTWEDVDAINKIVDHVGWTSPNGVRALAVADRIAARLPKREG